MKILLKSLKNLMVSIKYITTEVINFAALINVSHMTFIFLTLT